MGSLTRFEGRRPLVELGQQRSFDRPELFCNPVLFLPELFCNPGLVFVRQAHLFPCFTVTARALLLDLRSAPSVRRTRAPQPRCRERGLRRFAPSCERRSATSFRSLRFVLQCM